MKKIIKTKKATLKIDREIVRTLQHSELREVDGGQRPISKASNADVCCA